MNLTKDRILQELLRIFEENFEIQNPELDANLRENYGFDSLDAIEVLAEIEKMLGRKLTQDEKKEAVEIRTINQTCKYVERLSSH